MAWWAEQSPHLSKDDKLELVDWMMFASGTSPEIKKTFQDTIMKGDAVAMKTGFELWIEDVRSEGVLVGERKGKNDGKREKALEIAAGMKAEGMDVYTISRLTGLTIDEILQL